MDRTIILVAFLCIVFSQVNGKFRRCYSCRSRGEMGSCKDPFRTNSTPGEKDWGVEIVPCSSGWCSKIIEDTNNDDYGLATERQCLPRAPSDSEERCAHTEWKHKRVYMCFCQGDLCNSANLPHAKSLIFPFSFVLTQAFRFF